jgi:SAM-dependent methyltransferase
MPEVDLYNGYYDQFSTDVLGAVRKETYGEDLGQSSWMTADELRHFISLLDLKKSDSFLEVASGSGGSALFIAENIGCQVIGIDINEFGIKNANELARKRNLDAITRFQLTDASQTLPFEENRFDAVFSNDAICHIPGRPQILKEWHRVLKPGGRMLFTDALVVTGLVSHEEVAGRSSIGYYEYSPPGVNERLIQDCNFELIRTEDLTAQAAFISERWHNARERHRDALLKLEGESKFKGLQDFLLCVHKLSGEKRLSRFMYLAKKV